MWVLLLGFSVLVVILSENTGGFLLTTPQGPQRDDDETGERGTHAVLPSLAFPLSPLAVMFFVGALRYIQVVHFFLKLLRIFILGDQMGFPHLLK